MSDSRMVTPLPCSLGLTLSQTTMVLLWQLCGSTRFSLEVSRLHQQCSVSLWCAGQRGDTETLFLWLYMSSRAFLCCLMPAGFLLWNYFLSFQTYFFLSCGGDIKNLVFWWKTHLIKNIFNSCVVYCNSLADFSDFFVSLAFRRKKDQCSLSNSETALNPPTQITPIASAPTNQSSSFQGLIYTCPPPHSRPKQRLV